MNNYGLGFNVTATDEASAVFNKVGGHLGKMEKDGAAAAIGMQEAGNKFREMGEKFSRVGENVKDILESSAEHASLFQESILKAGAFSSATAAEMAQLTAAAQNTDLVLKGFSFEDQAKALAQLANETGNATDAIAELAPSLTLAKITGMGAAQAASFLSDVVAGMGKQASDSKDVVDKMAFAMKKFGLTANELEGAIMPTIGAAKLMGGSFEDTLTVVGIANSGLGNVRKSAMAATMALNQLSDPATQADFAKLGVSVKNSDGSFRNLTDILGDVAEKTKNMTTAQKAATLSNVYNAKTAGGLNVVIDQLGSGVKDASGNLLTGAAAAAELRRQMNAAEGAADGLAEAAVNTFGEQKTVLGAAVKSLMTAVGEPIQQLLAPIVHKIVLGVVWITKAFSNLSPTFKKVFVGIIGAVGVVASLIGSLLGGAAAVAALVIAGKALLIGLAGVAIAVAALAILFVPLIAVAGTLYMMWTKNIGGIQEKVVGWFDKIKLAFTALYEVFSSGGFSQAVYKELNTAENQGIKAFAINAFLWFNRIKNFFVNLGESFSAGLSRVGPVVERIGAAISRIASHFGSTTAAADENKNAFDKWGSVGAKVGDFLVSVVETVANVILKVVRFAEGFVEVFEGFKPMFAAVWAAASGLVDAFGDLIAAFTGGSEVVDDQGDAWEILGEVLGSVVNTALGMVVTGFQLVAGVVTWVASLVQAVSGIFTGMAETVGFAIKAVVALFSGDFTGALELGKQAVVTWATTILQAFLKVVAGAAGMIDSIGKVFKVDLGLKAKVTDVAGSIGGSTGTPVAPGLPSAATASAPAGASVEAARAQSTQSAMAFDAIKASAGQKGGDINVKTQVVLDGAVIGEAVQKHSQQQASRGFAPTPAPT